MTLVDPNGASHAAGGGGGAVAADPSLGGLPALNFAPAGGSAGTWSLQVAEADIPPPLSMPSGGHTRINPSAIEDIGILCQYAL
jgi:hypothetical protein